MRIRLIVVRRGTTLRVAGTRRNISAQWNGATKLWEVVERYRDGSQLGEQITSAAGAAVETLMANLMRVNFYMHREKVLYMEKNGRLFVPLPED